MNQNSAAYEQALATMREKSAAFRVLTQAFRDRVITTDAFLLAKHQYEQDMAAFDAAYAQEQAK